MAKKELIILGNETFKTKKEVKQRFKTMLDSYSTDQSISPDDAFLLSQLLLRHPRAEEKIGCGVKRFFKGKTEYGNGCFWLERTDGTKTEFSYISSVKGRARTVRDQYTRACRFAVEEDILMAKQAFFETHPVTNCELTGDILTLESSQVDHCPPLTFEVITLTFLAANNLFLSPLLFVPSQDGQHKTRFADEVIKQRFIDYHARVAVLRVVSRKGNQAIAKLHTVPEPVNQIYL